MNVHSFVTKFKQVSEGAPEPDAGQGNWTSYVRGILHEVSKSLDYYCCCVGHHEDRHYGEKREFLWDLTWYARGGGALDLPEVAIEHENAHSHQGFFADFWKVMAAFAPTRIMVGYTSKSGIEDRKEWIRQVVSKQGWRFPPQTTDLIVLKAYGPSEPLFLVRYPGEVSFHSYEAPPTWSDLAGRPIVPAVT